MSGLTLLVVPYSNDALHALAQRMARDHAATWPDLSNVVVLLGDISAATRLRQLLLTAVPATRALLGPHIKTLPTWLNELHPPRLPVLSTYARELVLTQALIRHSSLYGQGSPWTLTDSLLELFDELTLNKIELPAQLDEFTQHLQRAYGAGASQKSPAALGREAHLVHTLWRAWRAQLNEMGALDAPSAYAQQLASARDNIANTTHVYFTGFSSWRASELRFLARLSTVVPSTMITSGIATPGVTDQDYHPSAPLQRLLTALPVHVDLVAAEALRTQFLENVYAPLATPLAERARAFRTQCATSPVAEHIHVYSAHNAENEARAVDLQVRLWLLEGRHNVGIVTESRKLARRIRALLERAGVQTTDATGWALSTTSAAAMIERWLEAIEEDFAHEPLLDALKSPFIFPDIERDAHLAAVYRLEQDIVQNENVPRRLSRYRAHVRYRRERLPEAMSAAYTPVLDLLDRVERAAQPLLPFARARKHTPAEFLVGLRASFVELGLDRSFARDAAGQRILAELKQLEHAAASTRLSMSWRELRAWLARAFEGCNFLPPIAAGPVRLCGLAQTTLAHFDAIVIAGCEQEYLPGAAAQSPFFNTAVRADLQLSTAHEAQSLAFMHFRRLLEAAPRVLLTHRREQDGEDIIVSPWLELLREFHRVAYDDNLHTEQLAPWVEHPATEVLRGDDAPLPRVAMVPAPQIPATAVPATWSAHSYQQVMDCPYQFFAAQCLKLAPPEAVREALEKSDYGERVHRCLHAFFHSVPGLPQPFPHALDAAHRAAAVAHLESIAHAVFAQDLEDNFQHRGWLKRWLALIPQFIDWQIEQSTTWRVQHTELKIERDDLVPGTRLRGRIDRIDIGAAGRRIVDYKTGSAPKRDDVYSGEAVQLPFYALLAADPTPVVQTEFVVVDGKKISSTSTLQGEELKDLAHATGARLATIANSLKSGAPATAWGDERACTYCHFGGLCRKQVWEESANNEEHKKRH